MAEHFLGEGIVGDIWTNYRIDNQHGFFLSAGDVRIFGVPQKNAAPLTLKIRTWGYPPPTNSEMK